MGDSDIKSPESSLHFLRFLATFASFAVKPVWLNAER
jgi:hypothetical protein